MTHRRGEGSATRPERAIREPPCLEIVRRAIVRGSQRTRPASHIVIAETGFDTHRRPGDAPLSGCHDQTAHRTVGTDHIRPQPAAVPGHQNNRPDACGSAGTKCRHSIPAEQAYPRSQLRSHECPEPLGCTMARGQHSHNSHRSGRFAHASETRGSVIPTTTGTPSQHHSAR